MTQDFGVLSMPVPLCNGTDADDIPLEITDGDGNVIGRGRTPREIDAYMMAQYEASLKVMGLMGFLSDIMKQFDTYTGEDK